MPNAKKPDDKHKKHGILDTIALATGFADEVSDDTSTEPSAEVSDRVAPAAPSSSFETLSTLFPQTTTAPSRATEAAAAVDRNVVIQLAQQRTQAALEGIEILGRFNAARDKQRRSLGKPPVNLSGTQLEQAATAAAASQVGLTADQVEATFAQILEAAQQFDGDVARHMQGLQETEVEQPLAQVRTTQEEIEQLAQQIAELEERKTALQSSIQPSVDKARTGRQKVETHKQEVEIAKESSGQQLAALKQSLLSALTE